MSDKVVPNLIYCYMSATLLSRVQTTSTLDTQCSHKTICVTILYPQVMLKSVFRCLRTNPVSCQRNMSQSSLAGKVAIVTASTDG